MPGLPGNSAGSVGALPPRPMICPEVKVEETDQVLHKLDSCRICFEPIEDPVFTSCCGTEFCEDCLQAVREAQGEDSAKCPNCRRGPPFEWHRIRFMQSLLSTSKVRCTGCDLTFNKSQTENHMKQCGAVQLPCPNHGKGCGWFGRRNELENHVSDHCEFSLERVALQALKIANEDKDRRKKLDSLKSHLILKSDWFASQLMAQMSTHPLKWLCEEVKSKQLALLRKEAQELAEMAVMSQLSAYQSLRSRKVAPAGSGGLSSSSSSFSSSAAPVNNENHARAKDVSAASTDCSILVTTTPMEKQICKALVKDIRTSWHFQPYTNGDFQPWERKHWVPRILNAVLETLYPRVSMPMIAARREEYTGLYMKALEPWILEKTPPVCPVKRISFTDDALAGYEIVHEMKKTFRDGEEQDERKTATVNFFYQNLYPRWNPLYSLSAIEKQLDQLHRDFSTGADHALLGLAGTGPMQRMPLEHKLEFLPAGEFLLPLMQYVFALAVRSIFLPKVVDCVTREFFASVEFKYPDAPVTSVYMPVAEFMQELQTYLPDWSCEHLDLLFGEKNGFPGSIAGQDPVDENNASCAGVTARTAADLEYLFKATNSPAAICSRLLDEGRKSIVKFTYIKEDYCPLVKMAPKQAKPPPSPVVSTIPPTANASMIANSNSTLRRSNSAVGAINNPEPQLPSSSSSVPKNNYPEPPSALVAAAPPAQPQVARQPPAPDRPSTPNARQRIPAANSHQNPAPAPPAQAQPRSPSDRWRHLMRKKNNDDMSRAAQTAAGKSLGQSSSLKSFRFAPKKRGNVEATGGNGNAGTMNAEIESPKKPRWNR
ncbi:unnamed protein product [Amoebophrya sp. A120]|nr:unnamed protein product [Amoebophrya sp. A120]|eukprot:GSA120T00008123001.1